MPDDRLIGHLLSELSHLTDVRVAVATLRQQQSDTDRRLSSLETSSRDCQAKLQKQSREGLIPTLLRQHAIALLQWALFILAVILSAAKILPPWLAPLISALAPDK